MAQDSVDLARKATDAVAKRVMARQGLTRSSQGRVAGAGVQVEQAQAQANSAALAAVASLLGASPPQFTQVSGSVDDLPVVPSLDDIQQRPVGFSSALRRAPSWRS